MSAWVRGPVWDSCWLLSGLPLGLAATALVALGVPAFWLLTVGVLVFQTAHTISPIGLAWSHAGFRGAMLARPLKFIVIPVAILASWTVAGWIAGWYWPQPHFNPVTLKIDVSSWLEPLWVMGALYGFWNIYHFGKQNFGVMSIYRRKAGDIADSTQRRFDLIFCCTTAWAAMAVPMIHLAANYFRIGLLQFHNVLVAYTSVAVISAVIMLWRERRRFCLPRAILILTNAIGMGSAMLWGLGGLGIVSMNHWLTAIGLAGHTRGRLVWFPLIMIVVGAALFCALFIRGWEMPRRIAGATIAFRFGLGIIHFLYDRWVWKLSDPLARATIGRDLLKQRGAARCDPIAPAAAA